MNIRLHLHAATLHAAALLSVFAVAACGGDDQTPPPATATGGTSSPARGQSLISIEVSDNKFTPSNLTVPKGTKITWDWTGANAHSVIGKWQETRVQSEQLTGHGSFSFTFETAGTFDYQCGVHGAAMTARVTVKP